MADDFFSGLEQSSVAVQDVEVKLPFAVRDGRIFQCGLLAPVKKLKKMVPAGFPTPSQIFPGLGMIVLTSYEYNETDIGAFNEFSVVVPLNTPDFPKVPFYNLSKSLKEHKMHNLLLHRAATSETFARLWSDYYGVPEIQASIEFSDSGEWLACEVKEGKDLICRVKGRKIPADSSDVTEVFVYSPTNREPSYGELNREYVTTRKSSDAELTLGASHPIARELSETLRSLKPRMYSFSPSFQMIIYEPYRHSKPS